MSQLTWEPWRIAEDPTTLIVEAAKCGGNQRQAERNSRRIILADEEVWQLPLTWERKSERLQSEYESAEAEDRSDRLQHWDAWREFGTVRIIPDLYAGDGLLVVCEEELRGEEPPDGKYMWGWAKDNPPEGKRFATLADLRARVYDTIRKCPHLRFEASVEYRSLACRIQARVVADQECPNLVIVERQPNG